MKKLFILGIAFLFIACLPKDVKIEGVVCFDNKYGQVIPDSFSKVYLIEKTEKDTIGAKQFFRGMLALKINKADYKSAVINESKNADSLSNIVNGISEKLYIEFIKLTGSETTKKTIADINGNFEFVTRPGEYYIVYKSNKREELNLLDYKGTVEIKPVTVNKKTNEKIIF